jgi:hypothetical protein
MRRGFTAVAVAAALASPFGNAAAALTAPRAKPKPKKRVVTVKRRVAGAEAYAGRWGVLQVTLLVRKTTTIVGKRRTVKRTIVGAGVPV